MSRSDACYAASPIEFRSQAAFLAHVAAHAETYDACTVFDMKRRMRQCFRGAAPACYDLDAYAVRWAPDEAAPVDLAAALFARFRVVALRDFFTPAEVQLIARANAALSGRTPGALISGERCRMWKTHRAGAREMGGDAALLAAYDRLFARDVPGRLAQFARASLGSGGRALQCVDRALLHYERPGDQRVHADHDLPQTLNVMTSADAQPFYPTAVVDLAAATDGDAAALRALLFALQRRTDDTAPALEEVFGRHANAMFGPFPPILDTALLPPSTLLVFDPRCPHFGIGEGPPSGGPRRVHFATYTVPARTRDYDGDYTVAPEDFLLFPWRDAADAAAESFDDRGRRCDDADDARARQLAFVNLAAILTFHPCVPRGPVPRGVPGDERRAQQRCARIVARAAKRFGFGAAAANVVRAYAALTPSST